MPAERIMPERHALGPRDASSPQIRVEVQKISKQRNLSADQANQLFQQNFEHSLDQLIGAIRNQH
eukprot:3021288-Prymnesium_polylepis.1